MGEKMKRTAVACLTAMGAFVFAPSAALAGPFGYPLAEGTFAKAMVAGPDGNLWFTGETTITDDMVVGSVTPTGQVTEHLLPTPGYTIGRGSIVNGPDGNLWFTEWSVGAIGRSTTAGEITSFPIPGGRSRPSGIAVGPDGNLWFTDEPVSRIGRITPGGEITEFALRPDRAPSAITAGPDGNLWFTEHDANRIGRITTSGEITEFRVRGRAAKLSGIAAGPDGNLWFSEEGAPAVGRITPEGVVTRFGLPTASGTDSIISGPGGLLWFGSGYELGAIATSGTVSWPACLVPFCTARPQALAVGPDETLWVGAGIERCAGYCGGGTEISLQYLPGGIGRYTLPPLTLAIGPRLSAVRAGKSKAMVACGLASGCRGALRLAVVEHRGGQARLRILARGGYALNIGEARRIPVHLTSWGTGYIDGISGGTVYVRALAGPGGDIQAQRGALVLSLGNRG